MKPEESVAWDALRHWLETDQEGKNILSQLAGNTPEATAALSEWLTHHGESSPQPLINLVSGGHIEKLVNIARAGIVLVSQAKVTGPLLSLPRLALSDRTRLNFAARRTELVGREREIDALEKFIEDDRPFSWWLLTGPAGVGKSRLALDFCLQKSDSWNTGFIPRTSSFSDWNEWQPSKPTLAVIDYAADRTNMLRGVLRALSQHQTAEKIRFLLLERTDADYWWKDIIGYGTESYIVEGSLYSRPLAVSPMSKQNITRIVDQIVDAEILASKGKGFLKQIHSIEFLDRPLFAALAADAINNGRDPRQWDEERLVRDVLDREIHLRWIPGGITPSDMKVLVMSTLVSGLQTSIIMDNAFPELLPAAEALEFKRFQLATGGSPSDLIEPLEPDIVGEFFVLEKLAPQSEFHSQAASLVRAAWATSPEETASFISRASDDFPDHETNSMLVLELPDDPLQQYFWVWGARAAMERWSDRSKPDLSIRICKLILKSRFEHRSEQTMREYYEDAGYESFFNVPSGHAVIMKGPDAYSLALHISDLRASIGFEVRRLIEKLLDEDEQDTAEELTNLYLAWVGSHSYDPQSVAAYAWTAFSHIRHEKVAGQADKSIRWYRHVSEIAEGRPQHLEVWDARQKGLVNLITMLAHADRLNDAVALFAELRSLWSHRKDDESVGVRVAEAAGFLSARLSEAERFDDAVQLLEDTRALVLVRQDLSILSSVAEVTNNVAAFSAKSGDVDVAYRMLNSLRKLHVKGRKTTGKKAKKNEKGKVEAYLRTIQAVTAANIIIGLSHRKVLDGIAGLYDELQSIDRQGIASQDLADFSANALLNWLTTAYSLASVEELEAAYGKAREPDAMRAKRGPLVAAIGARLLAAILIRAGSSDRAISLVAESPYKNAEEMWTELQHTLTPAEIAGLRETVNKISSSRRLKK